jgi:ABC-type sulfate transport system permease component
MSSVLVVMAFVFSMPVAVVKVIQVSFMLHRLVGAVRAAVFMLCQAVLGVDFLSHFGHFRLLQRVVRRSRAAASSLDGASNT